MSGSTKCSNARSSFEAGTVTAFQPPPPSPTRSVSPDHSAFGKTTLHAENWTTDPPYGRRPDWRERVLVSACGQEVFIGGNPNQVASAATATRECRRNDKPKRPAPPACVVPLELDHFLYLCTHTPPRFHNPANVACAYYRNGSGTSASHPVPTRLFFPITLFFKREGAQMDVVCGFLFGIFT